MWSGRNFSVRICLERKQRVSVLNLYIQYRNLITEKKLKINKLDLVSADMQLSAGLGRL